MEENHDARLSEINELKKKLECYRFALGKVVTGVILVDENGIIFEYNQAASEFESLDAEKVLGKKSADLYYSKTRKSCLEAVMRMKKPVRDVYYEYYTDDDKPIHVVQNYYPVLRGEQAIGSCGILEEVDVLEDRIGAINEIKTRALNGSKNTLAAGGTIIGESKRMQKAVKEGLLIARTDADALVIGETGTGKELMVRMIHDSSKRKASPFVPINCATIPETLLESILFGTKKGAFTDSLETTGLFEATGNGTLFLDELNSMNLSCQSKLLRAIQEKKIRKVGGEKEIPIHCRIIGAINQDPWECIENGIIRKDLFYRISTACVLMPPLRERIEDLDALTDYFIQINNERYNKHVQGIDGQLRRQFKRYPWPGNVREFQNLIESMFILCDEENLITVDHIPEIYRDKLLGGRSYYDDVIRDDFDLAKKLYTIERQTIEQALIRCEGNKAQAAKTLGISPQNLNYKIKKFTL